MKFLILSFATLFVFGCGNSSEASGENAKPKAQTTETNTKLEKMQVGAKTISVEIANDGPSRAKGLMFRTSMPQDQGMLFVFDVAQPLEFWMRNTKIPLSIAYIKPDLTIANILEMVPASDIDQNPPRYNSTEPSLYALEMNKGWFAKNNIKAGTKIKLPESLKR